MRLILFCTLLLGLTFLYGQSFIAEIDSLNAQSFAHLEKDLSNARKLANQALSSSKENNYHKGIADANMRLAEVALDELNYNKAIKHFENALNLRSRLGLKKEELQSRVALAMTLSDFAKNLKFEEAKTYNARALKSFSEAIIQGEDLKDTLNLVRTNIHLGVHYGSKDLHESSKYFNRALLLSLAIGDSANSAKCYLNISSNHYKNQEYDSAIFFARRAKTFTCSDCNGTLASNANLLGLAFFATEQDDSALYYYNLCEQISDDNGYANELLSVYSNLINYHAFMDNGDWVQAYFEAYSNLYDSVNSSKKIKQFAAAQEQYHTASIEANSQKVKLRNRNLWLGIAASLLLLLGSIFVIRNTRQQKKLAEQGKDIADRKIDNLLQSQEMKNLDAMLEGQDNERKRIAADLHDRLGSILSTVKLHFTSMEDKLSDLQKDNQDQYHKATALLDEATNEVRRISHDLSTGTIAKFGLIPALYELKNTLDSTKRIKVDILEAGMDERLDMNMEISIYRIIQELIANTLKHAQAKKVEIQLTKMEDNLNIIIQDDGIGFDTSKASEGIGIQNIKQRVSKAEGEIIFDSAKGVGTTVILEFPI